MSNTPTWRACARWRHTAPLRCCCPAPSTCCATPSCRRSMRSANTACRWPGPPSTARVRSVCRTVAYCAPGCARTSYAGAFATPPSFAIGSEASSSMPSTWAVHVSSDPLNLGGTLMRRIALTLLSLCIAGALHAAPATDAAKKLAQDAIIVDTHIDAPENLESKWNDLGISVPEREFDYPRAREGGLDVAWMSIYTSHEDDEAGKAWQIANSQIDHVEALVQRHPATFALLRSPQDVDKLRAGGKVLLPLGMENGAPIGDDLGKVKFFFDRGVRYITLAHGGNNRIADSSYQDTGKWGGLSPFGEQVVKEMNRLGIIVDISHVSDDTVRDVLRITDVPVIASHSGLRHFTPEFNRNMPDDIAKAVAKKGGVIQLAFGTAFLDRKQSAETMERRRAVAQMEKDGKSQAEI